MKMVDFKTYSVDFENCQCSSVMCTEDFADGQYASAMGLFNELWVCSINCGVYSNRVRWLFLKLAPSCLKQTRAVC